MNIILLETFTENVTKAKDFVSNPWVLIGGIILIIIAVIVLGALKNLLLNSIIGAFGFLVCYFLFGIKLPLLPTIIVSAIFGPAGLGTVLILRFFGVA